MNKHYESLHQYYQNGCVLHPGTPPNWGEIGYESYMKEKIKEADIKPGDTISVEMKWHYGKVETYTGAVLHIYDTDIYMLSQGNKVWKDKNNEKRIIIRYITKIEKLKDAKQDFDIFKADPYYKPIDEKENKKWRDDIEKDRNREYQKKLWENYPAFDPNKNKILWLSFDFCWTYSNGKVKKADINVIKNNGDSVLLPSYKNKHIHPNHDYYSACGTKDTDSDYGGILLFFDSMEEIEQIRLVSCLWTVEIEDKEIKFMTMVYPNFLRGNGYVYNIHCTCTDMQMYEKSLYSHTVFSGRLEKEYDYAFLYISNVEGEFIYDIMNAGKLKESIIPDTALCLYDNSLEKVIESLGSKEINLVEVCLKCSEIKPKGYVRPY